MEYLNLKIGARARLANLRASAKNGKWVRAMTWRDCRFANLKSTRGLCRGFNGKTPIYYGFDNPFSRVTECETEWYSDSDFYETVKGVIVALPHGKFLSGYFWSSNNETVIYPVIENDEDSARSSADYYAEKFAELCRDDNEKYNAAREIEYEIESSIERLHECLILRHKMPRARGEVCALCEKIRTSRETLKVDYVDYC